MSQMSFAEIDFGSHRKVTRRAKFLEEMERALPWDQLIGLIKPFYPESGKVGRQPIDLGLMLRAYFVQQWYDLSDPALEEELNDSVAIRRFVGVDLGERRAPDETTILNFRHLLEDHDLAHSILEVVNAHLADKGVRVKTGTIMDATIIAAPSSTKNKEGKRDPEMHQTKKGNEWHFGMKGHIGADSQSKVVHSVEVTAANMHDSRVIESLLHGEEKRGYGDSAYSSQKQRIHRKASEAKDFTQSKSHRNRPLSDQDRERNRTKSRIRSRVEHVFGVIKNIFGFRKVRYRGLSKNKTRFIINVALANIYLHRKRLAR